MHHHFILVMANDLAYDHTGAVVIGRVTKRTCDEAVRLYRKTGITLVVASGWSDEWNVCMGRDIMAPYLRSCGVPDHDLIILAGKTFNSHGEIAALVGLLRDTIEHSKDHHPYFEVHIVTRWHHVYRCVLELKSCLGDLRHRTMICAQSVASRKVWMVGYEFFAILNSIFRRKTINPKFLFG